jgi:hypothetical protein
MGTALKLVVRVVLALAMSALPADARAQSLRDLLQEAAGKKPAKTPGAGVDADTAASGIKEALARGAK